jgi:hypothetical protein
MEERRKLRSRTRRRCRRGRVSMWALAGGVKSRAIYYGRGTLSLLRGKRAAVFGDKPPLISWLPFCAEGDRTQVSPFGRSAEPTRRRRALDFDRLPRPLSPRNQRRSVIISVGATSPTGPRQRAINLICVAIFLTSRGNEFYVRLHLRERHLWCLVWRFAGPQSIDEFYPARKNAASYRRVGRSAR